MENTDLLLQQNGEAIADGTVSGDDLFKAYQDGKSIDELQAMLAPDESTAEEELQEDSMNEETGDGAESSEEQTMTDAETSEQKPYKVYQTQEEFQKHFNHEWNKRYHAMKSEMSEQQKRLEETNGLLAEVLGVSKDNAFEELRQRRYAMEAEQQGYADPAQYAALKNAEHKIEEMKQAEEYRHVQEQVADIRRQGDVLTQKISGFNLDEAMNDVTFRQTVFSLQRAGVPDSVERAFRACFFEEFMKQSAPPKKETVVRPKEGFAAPHTQKGVKPLNVAELSGRDIRRMERDILSGRRVDLT